jgi:hypothetical protein
MAISTVPTANSPICLPVIHDRPRWAPDHHDDPGGGGPPGLVPRCFVRDATPALGAEAGVADSILSDQLRSKALASMFGTRPRLTRLVSGRRCQIGSSPIARLKALNLARRPSTPGYFTAASVNSRPRLIRKVEQANCLELFLALFFFRRVVCLLSRLRAFLVLWLFFATLVADDFLIVIFGHAAILLQDSAQPSQAAIHSSMSPTRLQSLAHSVQISAHSLQVCLWCGVLISMK